jgi:hypothetical protein
MSMIVTELAGIRPYLNLIEKLCGNSVDSK